jgi:predicted small secreted protein
MNKLLKFGLGLAAGAAAAHVAYHGYKKIEEDVIGELLLAIREHFSAEQIEAAWICEEPDGNVFSGGLVLADRLVSVEIDAQTLEITEILTESV